jgi:hypothetical protein
VPPPYTAKATGNTFLFRTSNLSASAAQTQCNQWGGHLATYVRWAEPHTMASRAEGLAAGLPVMHCTAAARAMRPCCSRA